MFHDVYQMSYQDSLSLQNSLSLEEHKHVL